MNAFKSIVLKCLINFKESLLSLIRILIHSSFTIKLKHLKVSEGSTCYILGNGPSLKENLLNDLDFIKKQELFAVNEFAKSEYYELLTPKYYVLADPSYYRQEIYNHFVDLGELVLNALRDRTTWSMSLFIPHEAYKNKRFRSYFENNKNITLISYNKTSIKGFCRLSHYLYKNYWGMPTLQNVLIGCIFISINMRFKEINILGADHSWTKNILVNKQNQVIQADDHFYDDEKSYVPFRHAYGELYKMHEILRDFAQMFESYHLLQLYAMYMNVKIFNLSKDSFIDAFERREITK